MRCACFRRKLALFTNFSRLFRHYALEKSFKTCIIAFCARCARLGPGTDFDFQKGIYNYETDHQDRCSLRPGYQHGLLQQLSFFSGTQTASAKGMNGDVTVSISFENGVATACVVDASTETESLGQAAAPTVADAIVAGNTPNVDAVSGSTVTSNAIMEAAKACYDAAGIAY